MTDFFRFPHTPHLAWLGTGNPREDKVFDRQEARMFLDGEVVVEEKVDGANLGFSVDDAATLRAQNRGRYLDMDAATGQWKPLKQWISTRRPALTEVLSQGLMLFGEWCYAVHSLRYTRLPDWFLAFDIYDIATGKFRSIEERNAVTRQLNMSVVPELRRGRFDLAGLAGMLGRSALTDGPSEGLYVRSERNGRLVGRAKLVRPEFAQGIDDHWSKRRLEANQMVRKSL